ncbi:MAG: AMP-binding protein [Acidobacteriota bacterium]|nr:AMP-binding protein [Blastocatellia bacterium]MDW8240795.1 AMP-binding protein [Acidobacteriota bacterium]
MSWSIIFSAMRRETLVDFFQDMANARGEFLVYDDGYRSWSYTYSDVARAAKAFAVRLEAAGIGKGDKVIIWSENRPEWVVAFWGCLLVGAVVVPIDYRASSNFLQRVRQIVQPRLILIGEEVSFSDGDASPPVWPLSEITASMEQWADRATIESISASLALPSRDDVIQIIFTSGATAEPKGVLITHRNILANIVPVENEILKYRWLGRPFFPLRFLNLLPLSHLFGQAMTMFIPPMLPGTVVFMRGYNPERIIKQIRMRRISVLVCVPKILEVLREYIVHVDPKAARMKPVRRHVLRRWWMYRKVHRLFGMKFWSFVVGAAPLDPALEAFWSGLGFLVIQGYGLTETAPIVTLNHPFNAQAGSVGKALPGVEVKIAPDGEILVRGENVTVGYYCADDETAQAFEDGWLHTGDIGAFDEEGRLYVRGRKKEMIVTPEGLNVFPEDVERVLERIAGVREAAVIGVTRGGQERVHAVLVLETGGAKNIPLVHPAEVVRLANQQLEEHQKIRGFSVWPGDALPRTEGTRKLKRRQIKQWVEQGSVPRSEPAAEDRLAALLAKYAGDRPLTSNVTLEELGLSSLERIELTMELEEQFQTSLDETVLSQARDLGELRALLAQAAREPAASPIQFPAWNRRWLACGVRRLGLALLILPLTRLFAWIRVEGREHLQALDGPAIFAANHQSHLDTPVIFAALPPRWRYRLAPAMSKEFFKAHFFPAQHGRWQWLTNSVNYYLACLFFNAFPLPQQEAGARQALSYMGELVSEGYCILIFPEGRRTEQGEISRFQGGVGMIASRLHLPVVPVRLEGLERVLHQSWKMARPGPVKVIFGRPLQLQGHDYSQLAWQVEQAVRQL